MFFLYNVVKYIIFVPNFIGAVLGAGSIVAGYIFTMMFEHVLVFDIPFLSFLRDIPGVLIAVGSIVFMVTFLGSFGAILDGFIGKWVLILHVATLSICVLLSIYIIGALHLSHRDELAPKTSALTADFNLTNNYNTKLNKAVNKLNLFSYIPNKASIIDKADTMTENNDVSAAILDGNRLRNRRSNLLSEDYYENSKEKMEIEQKKNFNIDNESIKLREPRQVYDKFSRLAGKFSDTVKGGIGLIEGLRLTVTETASFLKTLFMKLTPAEEEQVKFVRPLLGKLTGPAFRLSSRPIIMMIAGGAVILEICFIFLAAYFSTTKDRACVYLLE